MKTETESNRGTTEYTYDKNDNITQITDPEGKLTEMSYNKRDLIQTVTTGANTYSFTYDGNGNMQTSRDLSLQKQIYVEQIFKELTSKNRI